MGALELVVLIGVVVLAGEALARRIHQPATLILLVLGSLLGFLPGLHDVVFAPEVVLLLFLPALVYWESLSNTSLREIRANLRVITFAAVGLVFATAICVGAAGVALGLSWPVALALGAIVAPTDAAAVAGPAAGLPRWASAILRTESLVNDGTALAIYSLAVAAVVGGRSVSLAVFGAQFLGSVGASLAIGAAVGALVLRLRHFVTEELPSSALSLLTPFLAYLPAEAAHASGVVSVATCGIVIAQGGPRIIPAAARQLAFAFWQVASFVLNDALFVLTGLQMYRTVTALGGGRLSLALGLSGIVIVIVIGLRLLWFASGPLLARMLAPVTVHGPAHRSGPRPPVHARHRLPIAWAGMRGAISLAAALALPITTDDGSRFGHRDVLIAVTFAVIVFTVVVQGLSMQAVLRWSGVHSDRAQAYEEALALRAALTSALAALPEVAADIGAPDAERAALADEYQTRADRLADSMDDTALTVAAGDASVEWHRELHRALIPIKREAVIALRQQGRIDDVVLRLLQERLDAEELRLQ